MVFYHILLLGMLLGFPSLSHAFTIDNVIYVDIFSNQYLYAEKLVNVNQKERSQGFEINAVTPVFSTDSGLINLNSAFFYDYGTNIAGAGIGPIYRRKLDDGSLFGIFGLVNYSDNEFKMQNTVFNLGSEIYSRYFDIHVNNFIPIHEDITTIGDTSYKPMRGHEILLSRKIPLSYTFDIVLESSIGHYFDTESDDKYSFSRIGLQFSNRSGKASSLAIAAELGNDAKTRYGLRLQHSWMDSTAVASSSLNQSMLAAPYTLRYPVFGELNVDAS